MTRLRKAWAITLDGYDDSGLYFASTRSKAKGLCAASLTDAGYSYGEAFRMMVSVRRERESDVALPYRHWIANALPSHMLRMVSHAYGGTGEKAGYRDHYNCSVGDPSMTTLVFEWGLFDGPVVPDYEKPHIAGGMPENGFFYLTEMGKDVAASVVDTYPRECAA